MADGDVEVQIDAEKDDKAVVVDVSKPDKIKDTSVSAEKVTDLENDEGITELKSQLEEIKQRADREASERMAASDLAQRRERDFRAVQEELTRLRSEQADNRLDSITNAIAAAKAEGDAAEKDYAAALETGKIAEAAEAQRRMARSEARLDKLEDGRVALESERRLPPGRVVEQEPERPRDDLDSRISQFTPRTQAWLKEHRECLTDQKMNHKMMSAHYAAVSEGFIPDSDAYFDSVNRQLGYVEDGGTQRVPVKAHTRVIASAPVSRDAQNGSLTNRVTLNRREQEAAESLGLSMSEYARRKQKMQSEGWYDR